MGASVGISRPGVTAHGALTGLSGDDHPYAKKASNGSDFANVAAVRTNLGLGSAATASSAAFVAVPGTPQAFTVSGSAPASSAALPAALGAFSGVLLSDAITAITALQARVDLLTGIIRQQIERDVALGIASA